MQKLAKRVPHLQDEILHWVIIRGLRPWIKASIITQKGDLHSVADILEHAKIAESAGLGKEDGPADSTKNNQLMQEVRAGREEVQQLTAKMAKMSVSAVQSRSPTPERRHNAFPFVNRSTRLELNATRQHRRTCRAVVRSTGSPAVSSVRQVHRFSFVTIVVVHLSLIHI